MKLLFETLNIGRLKYISRTKSKTQSAYSSKHETSIGIVNMSGTGAYVREIRKCSTITHIYGEFLHRVLLRITPISKPLTNSTKNTIKT